MTVFVAELKGSASDPRFAERRRVPVMVRWDEASRRRLRRAAEDGTDVAITLDEPTYLSDGAVLDDDGLRVLVVTRPPEQAVRVRFDRPGPSDARVADAVRLGHALGNQHCPVEVHDNEVLIPVTTSAPQLLDLIDGLALSSATVDLVATPLGSSRPLSTGHSH